MNRNDFIRMIKDSSLVDRQMIGEVRELIDIFPYFQSAHLLLLKGLRNTSDVKFENQLKSSAIHVADREVLYYLLRNISEIITSPAGIPSETIPSENSVNEITQHTGPSENINKDLTEKVEFKPEEIEKEKAFNGSKPDQWIDRGSEFFSTYDDVFLLDKEDEPADEIITYTDPGFSVPDRTDLLELDLLSGNSGNSLEEGNLSTDQIKSSQDVNGLRKQAQSELIDKFILANPKIEPVREKSEPQVEDVLNPFIEGKESFVTETLAKIYLNQGYYSKAIDIYEKLSLKFPEKSSYFAAQIEKVKEFLK
jgi:hypothetical protein